MQTASELRELVTQCLGRALAHLERDGAAGGDSLTEQLKHFQRLKGDRGRKAVADGLGLHEAELPMLDAALRDVERTDDPQDAAAERNAILARMRLLSWFETIGQRTPALALDAGIEAAASEDLGRKQVRAVELVVRSLITESYGDQEALMGRLREGLGERVVERWKTHADRGDILSGCSFSELASLFVDKQEFERYEELYEDTPFLTLLKQRRRTVQSFLDDMRRVRNVLAHNKRVTPIQLTLLDLYYEELMSPVQTAFDQGETKVDPATHLDASKEDLERYVAGIHDDVQEVRDDLATLRSDLLASLDAVEAGTERIEARTQGIDKKLIYVGGGVLVLIALVVVLMNQGGDTQDAAEEARDSSTRTEAVARETADVAKKTAAASKATADATEVIAKKADETAEATKKAAADMAETKDAVKKGTAELAEAAKESKAASKASEEASKASKEAAEALKASSEKIVQTLDELRSGFAALTQAGGLIANPRRPQEHYHNARVYEQKSDYAKAMASYKAFFAFDDLEFIDPHLRFQSLLKLQRGVAGAREVYFDLKKGSTNKAMQCAWLLLLEGEARSQGMDSFLEAHPGYAPAVYARSRDVSIARLGSQTLADKRAEKALLTRFMELKAGEAFLGYYLDQGVAAEQVQDAEERLAQLRSVSSGVLENPVSLSTSRLGKHWNLTFLVAEQVKEILYRLGTEGDFKSLGTNANIRHPAGHPMPNMYVEDTRLKGKTTIQVKYRDLRGKLHGPFDVPFDPEVEQIKSMKSMLETTKAHWLHFRDFNDKLMIYFTPILSYRIIFKEIRYGIDKDVPDTVHPFPPADPDNPAEVRGTEGLWVIAPRATKYATVQITYKDGTKSEVVRIDR